MINSVETSLGTVLVDRYGFTIYLLTADNPTFSNCTSFVCNTVWPPVLATGGGVAGPGVQQSLLGTIPLPDGTQQVTYAGHPLYTYIGDRKPAQTSGQGIKSFGGIWWVLSATTGAAITGAVSIL
jgi:predicted lipoprotein with Yx(FWY)xxD motif